ncbi:MAG: endolytic transglycosylase MltG [Bacteroidetes bacterium]|nr:endolytic transglycosylase MltG [Bacteroidota bacterium]MBM3424456.1 endolytic transglycosylase MltG [Bacteroidota bacterium]
MPKNSKSTLVKVVAFLAVIGVVILLFLFPKIRVYWSGFTVTSNRESRFFLIRDSISPSKLAKVLQAQFIIDKPGDFLRVAAFKKLSKERIALGMYEIHPNTTYRTLLNGFTKNKLGNGNGEIEVTLTFNNCKTLQQMAGKVSKCIAADSAALMAYLLQGSTLKKYGFTLEQLPALFIPNTYKLFFDTDEEAFTQRMAEEFKLFWTTSRTAQIKAIGLNSPSEVTTLASIVFAEQSRISAEWPIIAGLYLNRIRTGMKLQSDPTFKFCWGDKLDGVQRLLAVHRSKVCPYNTYLVKGLPPGPINLPEAAVLDAVLNAPSVEYLFMCAKPDYSGRHNFAVSGTEHLENARLFQRWLGEEQKKK